MNRPMIVGATDHHDYDSLMNVGAEPATPYYGPPPPDHYYPTHPQQHHHGHHGQHGHHPQQMAPQYMPMAPHYVPPPQAMLPPAQPMIVAPVPQPPVVMAAPQGRHVVNEPMVKSRDWPLGFTSQGPVPPNSAPIEIEVKPQSLFKGRRLSVAHSIAKNFTIVDIKVGTNPQQGATGEMPAESFSSNAVDTRMSFDTASPGTTITIRVRNISNTPSLFMATLFGDVLAS
jgi:hypothetical protein